MEGVQWKSFTKASIVDLVCKIKRLGIDVKMEETATKEDIIKELDNVSITPHMALEMVYKGHGKVETEKEKKKEKLRAQEKGERMDDFLRRFRTWAEMCKIKKEEWLEHLWGALSPQAGLVLTNMEEGEKTFEEVEKFLKEQHKITKEGQLEKFRTERKQEGETYAQFGQRLKYLLRGYLELSSKEFEEMKKATVPMILEQLHRTAGEWLSAQVKRRLAGEQVNLTVILEAFDKESEIVSRNYKGTGKSTKETQKREERKDGKGRCMKCGSSEHMTVKCEHKERKCFKCNEFGHIARDCKKEN